ncbi:MAG: cellulase family glycosylhydrolase [Flavobacteriales bacterium]|nr:cellulase family glycosylhydrolase [Flavobacteriales bacterium]
MRKENFIQIKGRNYFLNGKKFIPKGINLGNWLNIESFMHGLPSVENDMHKQMKEILGKEKSSKYWKTYRDTFINEKDFEFIASKGFNCVRLPLNANLFYETEIFGEKAFYYIDKVFEWARKYNLFVQLDLHALPGGQARDHNADPYYGINAAFWDHTFFREQALDVVESLAERYAKEKYLWGYSPACEPNTQKVELLQEYYKKSIERIRIHDKHHIIILEPNHWARDVSSLTDDLFIDPQVTYQIHIYFFFHCDYNAMDDYPSDNEKIKLGRSELEFMVNQSIDSERIERPVTLAEFGVGFSMTHFMKGVKDRDKMRKILSKGTRDMRRIMEKNKGGWCLWSYKDIGIMGMVYPKKNNSWIDFINQPKFKQIDDWLELNFSPDFNEIQEDLSVFQKQLKEQFGCLHYDNIAAATLATKRNIESLALENILIELNKISEEELLKLASSFEFEQCQIRKEVVEIILKD